MELILVFAIMAIVIGGGGLVLVGIVWGLKQISKKSAAAPRPANPAQVQKPVVQPSTPAQPVAPTVQQQIEPAEDEEEDAVEARRILTRNEKGFFDKLYPVLANRYYVFPQIPLRQFAPKNRYQIPFDLNGMWLNGVWDFVLADLDSLDAIAVIELDDSSHQAADAQARDRRKDRFANMIGLPLLRVPANKRWDMKQIQTGIKNLSGGVPLTFLTSQECAVFRALRQVCSDFFIFPKASLQQMIKRISWLSSEMLSTLQNETADFLLVDRYLGTRLVVECEDGTGTGAKKGELLDQAKIQWLAVNPTTLDPAQLGKQIQDALKSRTT